MSKSKTLGFNEGRLLFDPELKQTNQPLKKATQMNSAVYNDYFIRLSNLAMSIFKWENLPETCNARWLEQSLYWYGQAIFFERYYETGDGRVYTGDIINTDVTINGRPLLYGDWDSYVAWAQTGENWYVTNEDSVLVRNNFFCHPTAYTIRLYAERFMNIERSCDTNIKTQKTPIVILTDQNNLLTWKNIKGKYEDNEEFIIADKNLDINNFKALQVAGPFIANDLMLYKHSLWNEVMTFLGISNSNTDKKERMITDEVQANDEQTDMSIQTMLDCRLEACEKFNRLYYKYGVEKINCTVNKKFDEFSSMQDLVKAMQQIQYFGRLGKDGRESEEEDG